MYKMFVLGLIVCFLTINGSLIYGQKINPKTTSTKTTPTVIKTLTSPIDSTQYILGAFLAQWLNNNGFIITNADLFAQGLNDMLFEKKTLVPDSVLGPYVAAYQRSIQKVRAIAQEKQLFEQLRDRPGVGQLPNGVRFVVLKSGRGMIASEKDSITVHMIAKLLDGTKVEDTYQSKKPFEATINSFFPGLNDALAMMPSGSKWQLFVPALLAYGESGTSLIPPNSVLILEVELVEVKQKQ
jgi:FKBP-type peptidyl-prolyl cis-trans isomerase